MTPRRALALLLLASGCAFAQAPIFTDGAAFGGARVFSDGLNPLGNSARFDRPATGTYVSWVQGDEGWAKDLGASAQEAWALRTRAYGVAYVEKGVHTSFVHEEMTAGLPRAGNADLRRAVVERLCLGSGSSDAGSGYGVALRVERWKLGRSLQPLGPGNAPDPLAFTGTQDSATVITFDAGYTFELMQGIRVGATVDRLIPRHFGDVYEGPQVRAGFQMDLGQMAQVSVDSDLNKAMRMPFPVRQRITTASLRLMPNPMFTVTLGAERRSVDGQPQIRGGVTVFLNSPGWRMGAGFQVSQDNPLKGLTVSVF